MLNRYTIFVEYPEHIEELDIDAVDKGAAKKLAEIELAENYEPGGKIIEVRKREGLYM